MNYSSCPICNYPLQSNSNLNYYSYYNNLWISSSKHVFCINEIYLTNQRFHAFSAYYNKDDLIELVCYLSPYKIVNFYGDFPDYKSIIFDITNDKILYLPFNIPIPPNKELLLSKLKTYLLFL